MKDMELYEKMLQGCYGTLGSVDSAAYRRQVKRQRLKYRSGNEDLNLNKVNSELAIESSDR